MKYFICRHWETPILKYLPRWNMSLSWKAPVGGVWRGAPCLVTVSEAHTTERKAGLPTCQRKLMAVFDLLNPWNPTRICVSPEYSNHVWLYTITSKLYTIASIFSLPTKKLIACLSHHRNSRGLITSVITWLWGWTVYRISGPCIPDLCQLSFACIL